MGKRTPAVKVDPSILSIFSFWSWSAKTDLILPVFSALQKVLDKKASFTTFCYPTFIFLEYALNNSYEPQIPATTTSIVGPLFSVQQHQISAFNNS